MQKIAISITADTSTEKDLDESKPIVISGVKGMKSTPFTKKFKNWAAYEKWMNSEEAGDYEVYQVKNASLQSTASEFPPDLLEAQKNLNNASSLIARYSATGRDEAVCKKVLNSIDKAQKDLIAVLKEYKND